MVVTNTVNAGNWMWVILRSSQCSKPLIYFTNLDPLRFFKGSIVPYSSGWPGLFPFSFFFQVLGMESRALQIPGKCSTSELYLQPEFSCIQGMCMYLCMTMKAKERSAIYHLSLHVKHNHGPRDAHSLHKKINTNSPSVAVPSLHPHSFGAHKNEISVQVNQPGNRSLGLPLELYHLTVKLEYYQLYKNSFDKSNANF